LLFKSKERSGVINKDNSALRLIRESSLDLLFYLLMPQIIVNFSTWTHRVRNEDPALGCLWLQNSKGDSRNWPDMCLDVGEPVGVDPIPEVVV